MRDELGTSYGLKLAEGTNCPITFTLDENLDVTGHVGSAQSITADEAYTIVSDADSVTVKARSATAGIWAAQTLLQLIGPWTNSTVKLADVAFIPAVNIADAPRYQWRGVLVDPARSFYPLDEMKQMIDVMSAYKMNTLHLHLSEDEASASRSPMTGVRTAIRPTTRSSRSSPAPSATSPRGPATGPRHRTGAPATGRRASSSNWSPTPPITASHRARDRRSRTFLQPAARPCRAQHRQLQPEACGRRGHPRLHPVCAGQEQPRD